MSASSEHTPGPWIHNQDGWVAAYAEGSSDTWLFVAECIETADRRVAGEFTDREYANACLIAAAPEMLEVLRRLASRWDRYDDDDAPELGRALTQVIALATGGAA